MHQLHISAALLIFGKKSRQSRFLLKNLRAIIRLHPTTEGVEIPMSRRQKCGKAERGSRFFDAADSTCNLSNV
jgi:hypothetical protein